VSVPRPQHRQFAQNSPNRDLKYTVRSFRSRTLKDAYGDSLRRVHSLFNVAYGFEARRAPGHTPHLIDKSIMEQLQSKYASSDR
jgi:UDP-N-acetylglucosamine-lysosomal-enzyme